MSATASTLPGNLIQGYRSDVGAEQVVLGKELGVGARGKFDWLRSFNPKFPLSALQRAFQTSFISPFRINYFLVALIGKKVCAVDPNR